MMLGRYARLRPGATKKIEEYLIEHTADGKACRAAFQMLVGAEALKEREHAYIARPF